MKGQFQLHIGYILFALNYDLPVPNMHGECKTKPAQMTVHFLPELHSCVTLSAKMARALVDIIVTVLHQCVTNTAFVRTC